MAHDTIIKHRMMQAHHANRRCKPSEHFSPGDLVYLSTKNLSLPKGWAKKLLPKFIGLYKIVEVHTAASMVTLDLPPKLTAWGVHPTFNASLIQAQYQMTVEDFHAEMLSRTTTLGQPMNLNGSSTKYWVTDG